MGKYTPAAIQRKKDLASKSHSRLSPRCRALLFRETEPKEITGPILSAVRAGATQKHAAAQGGLTVNEVRYMLKLAEDGHPAYRDFMEDWLIATSDPVVEVMKAAHQDATDPEVRDPARMKFWLERADREEFGEREKVPQAAAAGGLTVQVIQSFPEDGGESAEVEDAEFEEVVDE